MSYPIYFVPLYAFSALTEATVVGIVATECVINGSESMVKKRIIRLASWPEDEAGILAVIAAAKQIMRASGNSQQWVGNYPSGDAIRADVERHGGYVIEEVELSGATEGLTPQETKTQEALSTNGSRREIIAYFAFLPSPEPTYANIYDGTWADDTCPYYVLHRIASRADVHGIFEDIIRFSLSQTNNIRIDTHRDNLIMRHNITKHGFEYCGIIYLQNGDERLAYQRVVRRAGDSR